MFIQPETDAFLRFDYERMRAYASLMTFDENRNVTSIPDINGLMSRLPAFKEEEIPEVTKPLPFIQYRHFDSWIFPIRAMDVRLGAAQHCPFHLRV